MTLPVSPLQLGLIIAGVLLVVAVIIYNWWVERRVRRKIDAAFRPATAAAGAGSGQRVEPTLRAAEGTPAYRPPAQEAESSFEPPMDVIAHNDVPTTPDDLAVTPPSSIARAEADAGALRKQPDP